MDMLVIPSDFPLPSSETIIHPTSLVAMGNLSKLRPAPGTTEARREVEWTKMSNRNLKFAFDILSLHHSPWLPEALLEIQKRQAAGTWLNLNQSPPPLHTLPVFLTRWPWCLLWKQGRGVAR